MKDKYDEKWNRQNCRFKGFHPGAISFTERLNYMSIMIRALAPRGLY